MGNHGAVGVSQDAGVLVVLVTIVITISVIIVIFIIVFSLLIWMTLFVLSHRITLPPVNHCRKIWAE